MDYYLGIDIGTSGCKAVLFDENGLLKHTAYRAYNIISLNPGHAELNSDEIINKCFQTIKESTKYISEGKIRGIGISSQGEAFTLLDKKGNTLTNAFVSSDIRADEYAKNWPAFFGEDKLYRISGHTPHPMFSLFKLLWVKDNMQAYWEKAHKFLCFEDLLAFRLGVKNPAIGYSLAGRTMLFDIKNSIWSREILDSIDITESQLAIPMPSGSISGMISKEIARKLNLQNDTIIVTGGHDQVCSALGAGAIESGIAVYTAGTVDCITLANNSPIFNNELQKNNLCTYHHVVPDTYATIAYSLTGGNLLKWFRDNFGNEEIAEAIKLNKNPYELLLGKLPEEPSKLLVLPYFTPSGTPYFTTSVKGTILGLDLSTKREDLLKALLEGISFEMRLNLDILESNGYEINELRTIGGGAKSMIWNQLRADVMGKIIAIPEITEAGCMGAAILAKAACTGLTAFQIANNWIKTVKFIYPGESIIYEEKFKVYKQLYSILSKIYN